VRLACNLQPSKFPQFSRRYFFCGSRLAFFGSSHRFEDQSNTRHIATLEFVIFICQIYDRSKRTSARVRLQSYSLLFYKLMASTIALGIGIATAAFLVSNPATQNTIPLRLSMPLLTLYCGTGSSRSRSLPQIPWCWWHQCARKTFLQRRIRATDEQERGNPYP